jgi:hypothetical protein
MALYPFSTSPEANAVCCFHNELLNCTLVIRIQFSVNSCKPFSTASYVLALFLPFLMSQMTCGTVFCHDICRILLLHLFFLISFHGFTFPAPSSCNDIRKEALWYRLAEDAPWKFDSRVWEYYICYFFVRFEVLVTVLMKSSVFWDITQSCLPPAFVLVSCLAYCSSLKIEVTRVPETLVDFQQSTWHFDRALCYFFVSQNKYKELYSHIRVLKEPC